MNERTNLELERPNMRIVSCGLQLKVGAMMLLFGALILSLFEFIFFPEVAFTIGFVRYALGTLLALTLVDFTGRLLCLRWPKDQSARLAVILSSACQLGTVLFLILGLVESTSSSIDPELIVSISAYLLIAAGAQAASAVFFLVFTRRTCALLGQDKLAWRPSLVLAAYGLSGVGAMTLIIVLMLLTIVAFCCSFLGAWIILTTLPFRLAVSIVILVLVFFPFRSYGWFLCELAQAIDHHHKTS